MAINSVLSLGKGGPSASPSPERPYGTKGPEVPPADNDSENGTDAPLGRHTPHPRPDSTQKG